MKKPTLRECIEYSNDVYQSELFINYYNSNGWKVGRNPMRRWKPALTNWCKKNKKPQTAIEKAVSNTNTDIPDKFWVRMTQIFGYRWASNFGPEPTKPWVDVLGRLSCEEIARGLNRIVELRLEWPPVLTEFLGMCDPPKEKTIAITHAPCPKQIAQRKIQTESLRNESLNKMKQTLGV